MDLLSFHVRAGCFFIHPSMVRVRHPPSLSELRKSLQHGTMHAYMLYVHTDISIHGACPDARNCLFVLVMTRSNLHYFPIPTSRMFGSHPYTMDS